MSLHNPGWQANSGMFSTEGEETENTNDTLMKLRQLLDENLLGADAKWMLFITAVISHRYEDLLQPCPPFYFIDGEIKINELAWVAVSMPNLLCLRKDLEANCLEINRESSEHLAVLHWLLMESDTPHLWRLQGHEEQLLWSWLGQRPKNQPNFVFRVANAESLANKRVCYYSGDVDQLYSLISANGRGPIQGLRFFKDLQQACDLAKLSHGWGKSICGSMLRCVAVCEWLEQGLRVDYLILYGHTLLENTRQLRLRQLKEEEMRIAGNPNISNIPNIPKMKSLSWFGCMRKAVAAFTLTAVSFMVVNNPKLAEILTLWLNRAVGLFQK